VAEASRLVSNGTGPGKRVELGRAEAQQARVEAEDLDRPVRELLRLTASRPQQWWMPSRSRTSIRHSASAASEASVGVATVLMSGLSHTVNGRSARSASTSDATK
jgi:hypothetical protein